MEDQRKTNMKARDLQVSTKQRGTNERQGKECRITRRDVEKLTIRKPQVQKDLQNQLGRFMKFLEVKVHCHEIELCHLSSRFQKTMN